MSANGLFRAVDGTGECGLVLVHGGMCDHRDWDSLVPLLARDIRVIRPDLAGHGASAGDPAQCSIAGWARGVLDVARSERAGPAVLVGHSLGTRVVIEAARQAPDLVAGLVLVDGSRGHGGHSAAAAAPGASVPDTSSLAAVLDATLGPRLIGPERVRVLATMSAASPALMAACVAAMREWDSDEADAALAALPRGLPVLAIQSTYHDRFTPRRELGPDAADSPYLASLRQALPWIDVAVLPETGHFAMIERPGEVAALIAQFVARIPEVAEQGESPCRR